VTDQTQPSPPPEEPGKPFLDSFTIGAFRGLRDLTLDHLGRINLLVGKNNSGKTSVLEVLAIFAQPEDFGTWVDVVNSRKSNNLFDALENLFPYIPVDEMEGRGAIEITGCGRFKERRIHVISEKVYGILPENMDEEDEDYSEDINKKIGERLIINGKSTPNGKSFKHAIWRRDVFWRPRRKFLKAPIVLLAPYSHRYEFEEIMRFERAYRLNYMPEIVKLLQKIDKDIAELLTLPLPNSSRAQLMIRHNQIGLAPISVFGDGVRRALSIALAIPPARNGLLLIDEIESALHVSVLDTLYPWLVEACAEYNVQLFATTHSLEAVDAIAKLDKSINGGLSAYRLPDQIRGKLRRYTGDALRDLVHDNGLDIR
jgi:ABC-type Na+ transport system ATPase subunit NatA